MKSLIVAAGIIGHYLIRVIQAISPSDNYELVILNTTKLLN